MPTAAILSLDGQLDEAAAVRFLVQLKALPSEIDDLAVAVLRIRVGGGSLGAAQAVAEGLDTLREDMGLPVVAVVMETALSAGFFVAMACDHVIASAGATLGGCGAIVRRLSVKGLLGKIGVSYQPVSSGVHKDSFFPLATLQSEQEEDLKALVADHLRQFLDFVAVRRDIDASVLDQISEGQIFSGLKAARMGLIDGNGALFSGIAAAAHLISADDLAVKVVPDVPSDTDFGGAGSELIRSVTKFL